MDIFAREFGSEKDANGNTIMEDIDGVQCPKTKKVLAKETPHWYGHLQVINLLYRRTIADIELRISRLAQSMRNSN